jgi:hypothetical protein
MKKFGTKNKNESYYCNIFDADTIYDDNNFININRNKMNNPKIESVIETFDEFIESKYQKMYETQEQEID